MKLVSAFLTGLVFGVGLIVAGMANPAKVLGFLDIAGRWDPSLALVMAGAVVVALPAFAVAKRRGRALLGDEMQLPTTRSVDRRLLLGSLVFGSGWGLAGVCPGPALVLAGSGLPSGLLFLAAMLAGMWVHRASAR